MRLYQDEVEARRTPLHVDAPSYAALSFLTVHHGGHNNFLGPSCEAARETTFFLSLVPPEVNKVAVITERFVLAKRMLGNIEFKGKGSSLQWRREGGNQAECKMQKVVQISL